MRRAAASILRAAGWCDAHRVGPDRLAYTVGRSAYAVTGDEILAPPDCGANTRIQYRHSVPLDGCARIIVRDAVRNGYAPNMRAACALVAAWDADGASE